MLRGRNVMAALRRDMVFVWHAAIAVLFIMFVGLAIASALLDLWAMRH